MKKLLFLHGFFASGQCVPAIALRMAFDGRAQVVSPDLPTHPVAALKLIRDICDSERPDVLVGNSCGAFYAQILAPIVGVPALLGNPHFRMTEFLKQRIGVHTYKSERKDGKQSFEIDEQLVDEFAEVESTQFRYNNPYYSDRVWGLFGEHDTLAHFESDFLKHYARSFHFPGAHTPTAEEVCTYYVPLVEKLLETYPLTTDGSRFFQHFKGGRYRYVRTAFDSETQERMVVYQALYGAQNYWVRPEKMFFENIERDGRLFPRFTEIDG
ncbi:MAG: alpha/beta fold hydrolase [Marinilabiliaceae bacterium]|nr:alpha/beta fold hydrolase [Marinilabiliaceae bacterium]